MCHFLEIQNQALKGQFYVQNPSKVFLPKKFKYSDSDSFKQMNHKSSEMNPEKLKMTSQLSKSEKFEQEVQRMITRNG